MARDYRPSLASLTDLVEDPRKISRWLYRAPTTAFVAYAAFAAAGTCLCAQALREPFAVGVYGGTMDLPLVGAIDQKVVFVFAQVVGYVASKFLGIKVVSEMPAAMRAVTIGVCLALAELMLLLFALVPVALQPWCLFLNGLSLGGLWGLVFGFLEGRRVSDVLGAMVSVSYVVAGNVVGPVGQLVLDWGVGERWMPVATGALFALPTAAFVWMLAQVPPPTGIDEAERLHRAPMDAGQRWEFFVGLAPGLVLLTAAYVVLSAYREFRDIFGTEIYASLGYAHVPMLASASEIPVAIGALLAVGSVTAVRDNERALLVVHGLMFSGGALIGASTLLFQLGVLDPAWWMILVGLGLYVGYLPYSCVLFDRLIPAVGIIGTAGFMIYVTDAFGSLGGAGLLLYKSIGRPDLGWRDFFVALSWATALVTAIAFGFSAAYFRTRSRQARSAVSLDGGL